jgi:N-acetylglucosaminyl-diphospho-decaprenol L-rhamnosyltransferase
MKLYTIIVTYNGSPWIRKCLHSVTNSSIISNILVIDNNSTDNTTDIIKKEFSEVELIEADQNLGFGKANNLGMRKAISEGSDYVFLLNQDAWVEKDTIELLILNSNNFLEFSILSPMQFFDKNTLDFKFQNYYDNGNDFNEVVREVKFVNAAIWLIKTKDLISYGLFNECFKHYGEDIEFCRRHISFNKRIGIVKNVIGFHERPQKEKIFNHEIIERNLEIRILLAISRTKYNFLRGLIDLFLFLFFGNNNINKKVHFGIFKRLQFLYPTIKIYFNNKDKHII